MPPPPATAGDELYVFVSYARADQGYVTDLVKHFDDAGVTTWIDHDTNYGQRWLRAIRERLDNCAALVVVMTPTSEESEWVEREIIRAQQQAKTVLPLLLDGHGFFQLNDTQYEDVSDGRMPTPTFLRRLQHLTSTAPPMPVTEPTIPEYGQPAFQFWYDEGRRLYDREAYEPALTALDRAIELKPIDIYAHTSRGETLANLGRHEDALAAFNRAIELNSSDGYAHNGRGLTLSDLNRHVEALAAYDRAIELNSSDGRAHHGRGNALTELGRHVEAIAAFDRAIELNPGDSYIYGNRAIAFYMLERWQDSLASWDRVIELDSGNSTAHQLRGLTLVKLGRQAEADHSFLEAERLGYSS